MFVSWIVIAIVTFYAWGLMKENKQIKDELEELESVIDESFNMNIREFINEFYNEHKYDI